MATGFFVFDARNICRGLYYVDYAPDREVMCNAARNGWRFEPWYRIGSRACDTF